MSARLASSARHGGLPASAVVAGGTAASTSFAVSVIGLSTQGAYRVEPVVAAGMQGGDVVNLFAGPAVLVALVLATRGSVRAQLVLGGLLAYLTYCYGYYVFVPRFADAFVLHVAAMATAGVALVANLLAVDADVVRRAAGRVPARTVATVVLVVVAAMIWMEGSSALAFAFTDQQPRDVLPYPEWRVHLGFALDLGVVAPAGLVAGVLLWRRRAAGFVAATVVTVALAMYQLNYTATHVAVAGTGAPGITPLDPKPLVSAAVLFLTCLAVLLRMESPRTGRRPSVATPDAQAYLLRRRGVSRETAS